MGPVALFAVCLASCQPASEPVPSVPNDPVMDMAGCPRSSVPGPEPRILATNVPAPAALALDDQYVWFVAYAGGSIGRVLRNGTAPPEVFIDSIDFPTSIAVDEGAVYYSTGSGSIVRVDLATEETTELATDQGQPHALVRAGDHLYWTNQGTFGGDLHNLLPNDDAGVSEVPIDAGETPLALIEGEEAARGLAIADGVAFTSVYNPEDGRRIVAVGLEDRSTRTIATVSGAVGALAAHGDAVYWTRPLACAIQRAPVSGGQVESVASGENIPQLVIADERGLVWTSSGSLPYDFEGSEVVVANTDGGARRVVAAGRDAYALAVDGADIFFTNNDVDGQVAAAARDDR
jgi:hypothetical protein